MSVRYVSVRARWTKWRDVGSSSSWNKEHEALVFVKMGKMRHVGAVFTSTLEWHLRCWLGPVAIKRHLRVKPCMLKLTSWVFSALPSRHQTKFTYHNIQTLDCHPRFFSAFPSCHQTKFPWYISVAVWMQCQVSGFKYAVFNRSGTKKLSTKHQNNTRCILGLFSAPVLVKFVSKKEVTFVLVQTLLV